MQIDRNGLEVLSTEECLRLLGTVGVGRVAVSVGALPAVFPVNFVVSGADIIFRTSPGTKLGAAVDNAVVAFEVDAFHPFSHAGWSVLVRGHASILTAAADVADAQRLPLLAWATTGRDVFVRIKGEIITGRRLDPLLRSSSGASAAINPAAINMEAV